MTPVVHDKLLVAHIFLSVLEGFQIPLREKVVPATPMQAGNINFILDVIGVSVGVLAGMQKVVIQSGQKCGKGGEIEKRKMHPVL
jgi:hypothetical protein